MIRITITQTAYEAIYATLPLGSVGVEPDFQGIGERVVWLERSVVDRLCAMRGPDESYSDVILRLAAGDHERKRLGGPQRPVGGRRPCAQIGRR
jgi:hypothetical protein